MQVRHQVDLMDLGKRGSVEFKGIVYRYVPSVIDVFSWYIWLRPLARKTSKAVAAELKAIYMHMENGPPLYFKVTKALNSKELLKDFVVN